MSDFAVGHRDSNGSKQALQVTKLSETQYANAWRRRCTEFHSTTPQHLIARRELPAAGGTDDRGGGEGRDGDADVERDIGAILARKGLLEG